METPRASRVFTITLPENLAERAEKLAEEESRTISELFHGAFLAYLADRAQRNIEIARREGAAINPAFRTQDEIEGFVDEVRAKMYAERTQTVAQKAY
jgi:metal-responsive CopG/Arc/MetJ family transcriptional regulator